MYLRSHPVRYRSPLFAIGRILFTPLFTPQTVTRYPKQGKGRRWTVAELKATLTQLRFTSLAVVSSREDFHLQDRAHAGRT